jgi:surfeit locus 1 family protein
VKPTFRGVLAALLALTVAAVCVRLGFWQLDRLQQRRERNAALERALALPPLRLTGDSLAAVARDPTPYLRRRVVVRGVYDPAGEVVLRGRALEGRPGVHLVTPLRIEGTGRAVLVDRGWVPSADAATVDPRAYAQPGPRELRGILLPFPDPRYGTAPVATTVGGTPVVSYQRLDPRELQRGGPPLLGAYVQRLPGGGEAGGPRPIPLPPLDEGPHLGYAIQWFGFAAVAVGGLLAVALRRPRQGPGGTG